MEAMGSTGLSQRKNTNSRGTVDDKKGFEKTIRQISFFAFLFGMKNSKIKVEEIGVNKLKTEIFFKKCHEGWAIAQQLIIFEILEIEKDQESLKIKLKEYRRERKKDFEKKVRQKINFSKFKTNVLRSIGSAIGCTILGGATHLIRRLYLEELPPTLSTSNLGSVIRKVDEINENNPLEFALIADITNFIQIGDILYKGEDFVQLIEMKEGQKNIEAKKIIDNLKKNKKSIEEIDSVVKDKKMGKQVKRMFRQIEKGNRVVKLIKNDKGIDPLRGVEMKLLDSEFPYEDYHMELIELIEKCNREHHAYNVIEDCVLIGAYSHEHKFKGKYILEALIKQFTGKNYPVTNYIRLISIPTVQPIFSKPFGIKDTINIIFDRIRISLCIDFDKLIGIFNAFGAEANWLTTKQTQRIKEYSGSSHGIFTFKNQAILIKYKNEERCLGNGIVARILFDNQKPTSAVGMLLSAIK